MASGNRDTSNYLNLVGVNIEKVGYGKMVVGLRNALSEKVTLVEDAEHVVFALRPNLIKGWQRTQVPHLLTMWETNWLPPEFSDYLQNFSKVIVPSLHNWELFSQFHDDVHMIPLGVDRGMWFPSEDKPDGKFRIMCGGSEWYRKGMDVVLEVFNKLQLPDAELHIKIVPPYLFAPKDLEYPNVVVHREWLTVEQERDLVRSMHGFISVSRGEGFGLMPLQAISAGVPTILSDAHGHREFSNLATHRIPTTSVPTAKGVWQDMGDWDEPDPEALAEAIKDLYANRDKYRRQANLTAPQTAAFNWGTAADQLLQIVKPSGKQVPDDWMPLEPTCEIQVSRRIHATIGSHTVKMVPGEMYTVVLNVRDTLRESGYLLETL
jgi:glycosyltransferase involved in cell wall biosynthesis